MYNEIHKLNRMLSEAGIPREMDRCHDGWIIYYPHSGARVIASVVEHSGSYGGQDDLLEIMGLLTKSESEQDKVKGYLTAEDVFERISKSVRRRGHG